MLYTIFFFAFSISSLLIIGCQNQSSLISLTILLIRHCNTSRFMSRLQIIQGLYKWTVKQSIIYVLSVFLWKGEIFEHQTHQTIHRYFGYFRYSWISFLSKAKFWMLKLNCKGFCLLILKMVCNRTWKCPVWNTNYKFDEESNVSYSLLDPVWITYQRSFNEFYYNGTSFLVMQQSLQIRMTMLLLRQTCTIR